MRKEADSVHYWWGAMHHAAIIVTGIVALFYYWFGVADRYHIFLYNHLGATPFDDVTTGRYLMAGLVADGAVLVLYGLGCWAGGRLAGMWYHEYAPPTWWRVWLLCLPPLLVAIPLVATTVNAPTLPLWLAIACAVVTCIGLPLALMPGDLAARRPGRLIWITVTGMGLAPVLVMLRAVELPRIGLVAMPAALQVAGLGLFASAAWLALMVGIGRWRRWPLPSTAALLAAAFAVVYLVLPLVHHLFFTPPAFRYITSSSNFFAFSLPLQLLTWFVAGVMAFAASHLSRLAIGDNL